MGTSGEDLASKLRHLCRHQVEFEQATKNQESPVSSDPTLAYISKLLLEDEDSETEQPASMELVDELAELIAPCHTQPGVQTSQDGRNYVDSNSGTVDIHWSLLQCARAVAANNVGGFYSMAGDLSAWLSCSRSHSALEKVAKNVLDALKAKLNGTGAQACRAMAAGISSRQFLCFRKLNVPLFSASQLFGNEMILRACKRATSLHIVDYGIKHGAQWPRLMNAFFQRPEGPPALRITGIEFPDTAEASQTGQRLLQYARSVGVQLEYISVLSSSWEQVQPTIRPHEVLIVHSNLGLRHTKDDFVTVNNPRRLLFERIYKMKPNLFVICEVSASLSSLFFLPRLEEALRLFVMKMEYYEAWLCDKPEEQAFLKKVLAMEIMNTIACDGLDRVERSETYKSWHSRAKRAGFEPVPLDNEVYDYVKSCWGGYRNTSEHFCCGRDENWMLLGWKNLVMLGLSAWRPTLTGT